MNLYEVQVHAAGNMYRMTGINGDRVFTEAARLVAYLAEKYGPTVNDTLVINHVKVTRL